jgi:hypothetical protein
MPAVIKRETPITANLRKSGCVIKKSIRHNSPQWIKSFSRENSLDPNTTDIKRLEKELAFSCDTLSTIVVMIESLQRAYDSCRPDQPMEGRTRLNAAERELLAEYDDLDLQMSHLEKKIAQMERALAQLKGHGASPMIKMECPVDEWTEFMISPQQEQSLSPEQEFASDQEQAAIKLEDMSDWIDWSNDMF